jgi:hypothetical protein
MRIWRVLLRLFGVLLLFAALFVAYWWLYKLGPARRKWDARWVSQHSWQEYWQEVQKGIHRGAWSHDDGQTVGMFGDKAWAEWIMSHVEPGTSMGCFAKFSHSATAMQFLTNQDVGGGADAWLEWWEENGAESQEEWIKDGFAQRGFKLDVPPTSDQTPVLLALLGNTETDESVAVPIYMKYNAFRCLRDSGFEPVQYALSSRKASADIERGLLEYAKWERRWPEAIGVGKLPFAKQDTVFDYRHLPAMMEPGFRITAYSLIVVPLALGTVIIVWSFRKRPGNKARSELCQETNDASSTAAPPSDL